LIQTAYHTFGISDPVIDLSEQTMSIIQPVFQAIDRRRTINQLRIIDGFQKTHLSESYFGGSTGYGYGDQSREQLESAFAFAMGAEASLVRIQISSGTQAISLCLFAMLRPGDELLSVTGLPYDTIQTAIGCKPGQEPHPSSLKTLGVSYREVVLLPDGSPDLDAIRHALTQRTRMVFLQKSRGYTQRRSLLASDIKAISDLVHSYRSDIVVFVDNCYGEFVETEEPCMTGADLCAGSLIKNPGGGLCPSGGYAAGRSELVERVADRLNAPGLGRAVGPTLGFSRLLTQGLYMAPQTVSESLKGAVFAAAFFDQAGLKTTPGPFAERGDIVQTIDCQSAERLTAFCQMIQKASPVDFFVYPEAGPMPGYDDPVIMAAGAFVQGASIELSADGPMRPPYPAYMQGGLSFDNIRLACMMAAEGMRQVPS
jgi:cystathionine beta-lyase family protein involved in aluminum resistance